MDKDPEDVRYNFVRWLNNDIGTAIGPSRVHPLTGQILDADIILTDGWIRHFDAAVPRAAAAARDGGVRPGDAGAGWRSGRSGTRVCCWPRPAERARLLAGGRSRGRQAAGHRGRTQGPATEFDGLVGRNRQANGFCTGRHRQGAGPDPAADVLRRCSATCEDRGRRTTRKTKIDGIPAKFVGPLLADLVAHEVGHTLGLRHNFAASGLYTLAEINSHKLKGKKPFAGSVMDYIPLNIDMKDGETQGDYAMIERRPVRRLGHRVRLLVRQATSSRSWPGRTCPRTATPPTRTRSAPTRWPGGTTSAPTRSTTPRTR